MCGDDWAEMDQSILKRYLKFLKNKLKRLVKMQNILISFTSHRNSLKIGSEIALFEKLLLSCLCFCQNCAHFPCCHFCLSLPHGKKCGRSQSEANLLLLAAAVGNNFLLPLPPFSVPPSPKDRSGIQFLGQCSKKANENNPQKKRNCLYFDIFSNDYF